MCFCTTVDIFIWKELCSTAKQEDFHCLIHRLRCFQCRAVAGCRTKATIWTRGRQKGTATEALFDVVVARKDDINIVRFGVGMIIR